MSENVARLHPNLVQAVEDALYSALIQRHPADKVLARLFKGNPQWGARDRAFIAETTYSIIRYLRHYTTGLGPSVRWGHIIAWHLQAQGLILPDWPEWRKLPDPPRHPEPLPLAIRESITNWLNTLGETEYGERWPALLHALNQPASVVLRVNPLQSSTRDVRQALDELGIETIEKGPWALELVSRANVFNTDAFKAGWFEVQDLASQQIAPALDVQPGHRIIDACAGAGGKTLHLAALAENKGLVIALDTEVNKLLELKKRAARAGAFNVETRLIDHRKVIKRLYQSADRLLLDVPCTGTGVLRRNPDTKWKIGPEVLEKCTTLQAEILDQYVPMCKAGGRIVYATCSILREENQDQIARFLERHPDYTLLEERQLLPDDFGYDGFYYAVLSAPTTLPEGEGSPDDPSDS